jgi:hypothetical protein
MKFALLIGTCIVACTACMPTDEPIAPYPRTGKTTSASLGETYAEQVFVDLSTNSIVRRQPISSWHFAVDCGTAAHTLYLNDALIMSAVNMNTTDWLAVTKAPAGGFQYEPATGAPDSLPMRDFWPSPGSTGNVYVVHLGRDDVGNDLGHCKVQGIRNLPHAQLRYGTLDGKVDTIITIEYDVRYRRRGMNAFTRNVVQMEPETTAWDVLLTRYTQQLRIETGDLPYVVVGVLLNQPHVRATLCKSLYADAMPADTLTTPLKAERDAIGYLWKQYDRPTDVYTVDTAATFLVSDRYGYLRALRFLDFYDEYGTKGTLLFEHRPF